MENWKSIKGYEGIYEVSDLGKVRSIDRIIRRSDNKIQPLKGKVLSPFTYTNKYIGVTLYILGKSKNHLVHRLVAQSFINNPENKEEVNHIDGVKNNNKLSNLEWNTRIENIRHSFKTGLSKPKGALGIRNIKAKLTEEQVLDIRKSKELTTILMGKYNVSRGTINRIRSNKTWKHLL